MHGTDPSVLSSLPPGRRFPDRSGKVYVAGWGTTHDSKCTTNEFGPSPNAKCKFPFRFKSLRRAKRIRHSLI